MAAPAANTLEGPNLFIVGAPKCGTTALNDYLAKHPEVFMATKEQHYFGSDLEFQGKQTKAVQYFPSFSGAGQCRRRGEASVWYLFSQKAAREIHAYNPRAQVIVMLRNPVDMMYSLH